MGSFIKKYRKKSSPGSDTFLSNVANSTNVDRKFSYCDNLSSSSSATNFPKSTIPTLLVNSKNLSPSSTNSVNQLGKPDPAVVVNHRRSSECITSTKKNDKNFFNDNYNKNGSDVDEKTPRRRDSFLTELLNFRRQKSPKTRPELSEKGRFIDSLEYFWGTWWNISKLMTVNQLLLFLRTKQQCEFVLFTPDFQNTVHNRK